jgi:hypothetical protein
MTTTEDRATVEDRERVTYRHEQALHRQRYDVLVALGLDAALAEVCLTELEPGDKVRCGEWTLSRRETQHSGGESV